MTQESNARRPNPKHTNVKQYAKSRDRCLDTNTGYNRIKFHIEYKNIEPISKARNRDKYMTNIESSPAQTGKIVVCSSELLVQEQAPSCKQES